jgi:hypothetical protein
MGYRKNPVLAFAFFCGFAVKYLELLPVPHPRRAGFWCSKGATPRHDDLKVDPPSPDFRFPKSGACFPQP